MLIGLLNEELHISRSFVSQFWIKKATINGVDKTDNNYLVALESSSPWKQQKRQEKFLIKQKNRRTLGQNFERINVIKEKNSGGGDGQKIFVTNSPLDFKNLASKALNPSPNVRLCNDIEQNAHGNTLNFKQKTKYREKTRYNY